MSFLSFAYLLFLPAVFAVHWAVPARFRWATLLASSLWFFASAAPRALPLLLAATALSWVAGLALGRRPGVRSAKALFAAAVALPLGSLLVFKYAGFALRLASDAAAALGFAPHPATLALALPLGLSFWTFSIVSYLVDVRRGTIPAERHPGRYAAFVLFFPKIVSGPIERAGRFLPQVAAPAPFSYERASRGIRQIALGLVRKAVVADFLANWTDAAFVRADRFHGVTLAFAAVLYSVQIYNDFAGYSDIAIGSARLLGIDLADNFRAPVFARNLRDFWSRWHISLSTWFRDYLYIPLGGSRRGAWRTRLNLLATFAVSGLWHGASLTFLAWGCIHGLVQVAEKAFFPRIGRKDAPPPRRAAAVAGWAATFLVVTVAWTFFRAESVPAALSYLSRAAAGLRSPFYGALRAVEDLHLDAFAAVRAGLPAVLLGIWDFVSLRRDPFALVDRLPFAFRWLLHAAVVAGILYVLLPQGTSSRDFIYFRF
ncbi:MAG: MBOAT family protein [Kiritimatiellae bacterium]|nr:MBOAT family protein [Kiritimatiellia bacterium]